MQSRIAKVFKKYSFSFLPIMRRYDKEHGGGAGGEKIIIFLLQHSSVMPDLTSHLTISEYDRKATKI